MVGVVYRVVTKEGKEEEFKEIALKRVECARESKDCLYYTEATNKSWKKISPVSDEEGGRPPYTYDGMPLVFTRENGDLGTIEYATVEFGAGQLYVHFIVYEK